MTPPAGPGQARGYIGHSSLAAPSRIPSLGFETSERRRADGYSSRAVCGSQGGGTYRMIVDPQALLSGAGSSGDAMKPALAFRSARELFAPIAGDLEQTERILRQTIQRPEPGVN